MIAINIFVFIGTGDRNELFIPTLVDVSREKCDQQPVASTSQHVCKEGSPSRNNKFLPSVGCGGDFTVFVNPDGDVFAAGNSFLQVFKKNFDLLMDKYFIADHLYCYQEANSSKSELRIVMFKNTKRIVRLPKPHTNLQKTFKYMPLLGNFLHQIKASNFEIPFEWPDNPIYSMESFENSEWASKVLGCLYEFVDDDTPLLDTHLRASLAIFKGDYADGMNLQLSSLLTEKPEVCNTPYLQHNSNDNIENLEKAKQLLKSKINSLSREWLSVPHENVDLNEISCLCDENRFLSDAESENKSFNGDILSGAITVTKSILKILTESGCTEWSDCISEITNFWINNKLNMDELENIFMQNMVGKQAVYMGVTIFCSRRNVEYQKTFSTYYKLVLCEKMLQSIN